IALGAKSAQSGRLTIGRIRHLGDEPLIRPLSLQLDVKGQGDRLTFDGALKAAGDRAQLQVQGRHNLGSGIGEATLKMAPVVFAPGVLQPRDFVPALYRSILETLGEVAADAKVAWGPDGLTSENAALRLSIDKVSTGEIVVDRLATTFRLDKLLPPRTAGPQRIRIGRLDVGVPLARGVLDVNIISPNRVEIDIDRFDLFGGFIKSQRLVIDPTSNNFDAVLQVEGIDFARILAFAEFGELTATGRLEGRIPIHYKNGDLRVTDGLLKTSSGGGVLQYRPKGIDEALKKADRSTSLAIRALANFAYEEISVRINEVEAEEVRLDIFIKGKSLDVFDGVPFEFNIVIEGPLRQIVQESLAAPVLPPDIQDLVDRGKAIDQPAQ
ncbi:MAG: intermembrane phospholipid transport protein YdbH family protein, partial [Alphaproteobacteria bacterium]